MGSSANSKPKRNIAVFNTREEAEKFAKNFNCTGAHQMNDKWMPCMNHNSHDSGKRH